MSMSVYHMGQYSDQICFVFINSHGTNRTVLIFKKLTNFKVFNSKCEVADIYRINWFNSSDARQSFSNHYLCDKRYSHMFYTCVKCVCILYKANKSTQTDKEFLEVNTFCLYLNTLVMRKILTVFEV